MDEAMAEGGTWFWDRQAQFPAGRDVPIESDFSERDDDANLPE